MKIIVLSCFAVVMASGIANDGGLTSGGSPRLLNSHPTIRMESEVIKIKILNGIVTTDCQFTFVNDGKACDVTMGFPDKGFGEQDPRWGDEMDWKDWKPVSVFESFQSWINGKPSKTSLVKGKNEGEIYHSKRVHFLAKSKVNIRDLYVMREGSMVIDDGRTTALCTGYILATGASWKGNIGSTTVSIQFDPAKPITEMKFGYAKQFDTFRFAKDFKDPVKAVRCRGPVKPSLTANTLSFKMKNWRPTAASDIYLEYHSQIGQG